MMTLTHTSSSPRIGFVSLGCPKALVDSEHILSRLKAEGYDIAESYQGADLVVVNTCGFIDAAVAESLAAIGEALAENGKVIVTGCLGARNDGSFVREIHPRVLAVTGPHATDEVLQAIHAHLPRPHEPFVELIPPQGVKLTPRHYAYLKISEGCNHRCTFCIIPSLRGSLVSYPMGNVVNEAEKLLNAGVRELLVVSQDTGAYGADIRYRTGFHHGRPLKTHITTLTQELDALGRAHQAWVRLHYVYPYPHVDDLVALMRGAAESEGGLLPYLDMPLQHASPRILKAMQRPAAPEKVIDRIRAWRHALPQLTLRSTFIVGFPGETEDDFLTLLQFLEEAQLDRVGAFPYSPVNGAAANALPDALPEEIKQERLARFMETQAAISARRLQNKIGQTITVLVDHLAEAKQIKQGRKKTVIALARSAADAPEIDGLVQIADGRRLLPGMFVKVHIEAATEHDLIGHVGNQESEARD
ncbi:MAG: 30S ribosomal protein S12 methylthiotransferase RimO [Burkholderiales bacterium]|nr:30S ribosomal protein S12 methylthiotransferase RimO [Burkholderiales bacterium]